MEKTRNYPHQHILVTWAQVKTLHNNKLLIYKTILKPIRGTPSTFNTQVIGSFPLKAVGMDTPSMVPNMPPSSGWRDSAGLEQHYQ